MNAEAFDRAETLASHTGPTETPRSAEWIGRLVGGKYRIVEKLDEGGTSTVFAGQDADSGKPVVVKLLASAFAFDPEVRARFCAEADMLRRVEHPHVVRLKDDGWTDSGLPFLVLEFLEGEPLRDRIRRGPMPLGDCVRIAGQIGEALAAAHARAIVHRDVKPANIFLCTDEDGRVHAKLLDFGISKELDSDVPESAGEGLLGTPEYMAPEQANGCNDLVDARTDQYALALVLYEMLTRQRPFAGRDVAATLNRVRSASLPPVSMLLRGLGSALDGVFERALAKSRDARFRGMEEFSRGLEDALRGHLEGGGAVLAGVPTAGAVGEPANEVTMPSSAPPPPDWFVCAPLSSGVSAVD
ncbi:MAG TPA: serine/threonine-protein kinase [Polyangiaceae bacterium]|nr:serine/threonine-protein kinase [Polyangiaceae bacterium]